MPRKLKQVFSTYQVPDNWVKALTNEWINLIKQIPGYDPFFDAGDCRFDVKEAQRALDFFEHPTKGCIRHVKGELAGEIFKLQDWQRAIIVNIFGWKKPDGTRRYREVFIYVPRKNGKTALAAGLVLYVMFCDGEPGAEIYSAAADRDQAGLVFQQVTGMVEQEPELSKRCKVYTKAVAIDRLGIFYKPISADAHTKHGYNGHCIIIDELHAQPNRELVDVLTTSTGARRQPLVVYITTADYDRESICNETLDRARMVRDYDGKEKGTSNPSFLPVIYEALPTDNWEDPEVWKKANPNYGVSVYEDYFQTEYKKAKELPALENTFKRLHLNIRTGQDIVWIPLHKWDECGDRGIYFNEDGLLKKDVLLRNECTAGFDLSAVSDITAFVLWFYRVQVLVPFFWVPKNTAIERERKGKVPYSTWERMGYIRYAGQDVIDYDVVRGDIFALRDKYRIVDIGIDRWNATEMEKKLTDEGFTVTPFGQGYASMTSPCRELERLIVEKSLSHGGNPVLRWMASVCAAELDPAGNIKPSKKKSTDKIDGIVASAMAIGRALQTGHKKSVYETRGFLSVNSR